jgi:hypothetical protein
MQVYIYIWVPHLQLALLLLPLPLHETQYSDVHLLGLNICSKRAVAGVVFLTSSRRVLVLVNHGLHLPHELAGGTDGVEVAVIGQESIYCSGPIGFSNLLSTLTCRVACVHCVHQTLTKIANTSHTIPCLSIVIGVNIEFVQTGMLFF